MHDAPEQIDAGAYPVLAWFVHTLLPAPAVGALADLLDDAERDRSARMPEPRRTRFVVAHAALRQIVGYHTDTDPRALRWRHGANGKPHLVGLANAPAVNLTHSGHLAVVAVGPLDAGQPPRAVGVDVEVLGAARSAARMAERYYRPDEARYVNATNDPDELDYRFVRLWTRKEACVKAAGARLFQGLRLPVAGRCPTTGLVVSNPRAALPGPFVVHDIDAPAGACAAVALEGADPFQVTTRWWRPTANQEWREAAAAMAGVSR